MAVLTKTWFDDRSGLREISPLGSMYGRYTYLDLFVDFYGRHIQSPVDHHLGNGSKYRAFQSDRGTSLDFKTHQRFWQKCPTKFRSGGFWHPKVLKNTTWGIWKLNFLHKMKRKRWKRTELGIRALPSPMGFPEMLAVTSSFVFFWWDSDAQNESPPCLGVRFLANFLPET